MENPNLNESLNYLAQYEPHFSVLVKYIEDCRQSWISELCNSSIAGNDDSQRSVLIGKISTYEDVLNIFKYRTVKQ